MPHKLSDIAALLGVDLSGADAAISGMAPLESAGPAHLSLCIDRRRASALRTTRAAGVLLPASDATLRRVAPCAVIPVVEPRLALARVLEHLVADEQPEPGIQEGARVDRRARVDPTARVEPGACIQAEASVGAGSWIASCAVIGTGATVGAGCRLEPHAVVGKDCLIGDRVVLGAGAVVGSAGFGFVRDGGGHRRIKQIGRVVIEDDVEIGAGSTIDRATLGETRIGAGTKIDNLVQVGHNVQIGREVIIAAQCGLSGSVVVEDGAMLGGQVGVSDHVRIGAGAQVGAKSGVGSHVAAGARVAGYPAMPVRQWLESAFLYRRVRRLMRHNEQGGDSS